MTASLLLTLSRNPPPRPAGHFQSALPSVTSLPVTLDLDAVAADLQVSGRTLWSAFSVLCTWWPTEVARLAQPAPVVSFSTLDHSRYRRWKFYSATGSKTWRPGTIIQLDATSAHLSIYLRDAGIATLAVAVPAVAIPFPIGRIRRFCVCCLRIVQERIVS